MCDFPARQLLRMAIRAVEETDWEHDPAKATYASGFIKSMGDLAAWHQDLTGCRCWEAEATELGYFETYPFNPSKFGGNPAKEKSMIILLQGKPEEAGQ